MTFLHPWALAMGVAAAALPVAIHLLTRPRPVRMPLSTLRFVRAALRQQQARHRLRDLIVLALRTAAILALAVAVARPQYGEQPLVSDQQPGDAVRVVLLDVSQSLAATDHGIAAIERARTRAARHFRYRPGLRANLVVAGARPRPIFEQVSTNFEALRAELARCQVLPERVDVAAALEEVRRLLAPASAEDRARRELVVISDFQRGNWAKADFAPLPEGTQLQLESVAPATPPPNLAIVRAEAHASGSRGRAARLEIEVGNYSPTARTATVEVTLGGATWRREVTCAAHRTAVVAEEIELSQPGWQCGSAVLAGVEDALAADNLRPLVVRLRPPPAFVLITRQPGSQRPSASHYLECALVPDAARAAGTAPRLARVDPAQADQAALTPADVIVLDHPGKLADETIKLLVDLLRRGRAVVYVAAEPADAVNLKSLANAGGSTLRMAVEFAPPPLGQAPRERFLGFVARRHAVFGVFGDQLDALTTGLRFGGGLTSRGRDEAVRDDVLASYADGSACLLLTDSEAGTLAVLNADLGRTNLVKSPLFVPLLDELVGRMLNRRQSSRAAFCGEPLVARLPVEAGAAGELRITRPDADDVGERGEAFGRLMDEASGVVWQWPAPTRPGVYQVRRDREVVFAESVTLPPEESDLENLPAEVLTRRLAAGRSVYYQSATEDASRRDTVWKWFALICSLCLLGEVAALLGFRS